MTRGECSSNTTPSPSSWLFQSNPDATVVEDVVKQCKCCTRTHCFLLEMLFIALEGCCREACLLHSKDAEEMVVDGVDWLDDREPVHSHGRHQTDVKRMQFHSKDAARGVEKGKNFHSKDAARRVERKGNFHSNQLLLGVNCPLERLQGFASRCSN